MAELWVNDSGVARQVREVWVNDSGVARRIQEIWVNDSGTARRIYLSDVITISDFTAQSFTTSPVNATATYRLENDGDIGATQGDNTINDIGDWITPKVNMAAYEARADLLSGTLTSGTTGAWQSLASTRTWTLFSNSSLLLEASFTLSIRRASDAVVLDTATITLQANRTAP